MPTIPGVALDILAMSQDPETSIEALAETIERDPALAAKTLKFANSTYYGAARPIVSLSQALIRIGMRGAKMLALSFSLIGASRQVGPRGFDYPAYWYRSLTTSVAARRIALRSVRHLADHAFIAGLLADVGCPVLAATFPKPYTMVQKMLVAGQSDLPQIEQRLVGVTHTDVSRMVLEAWHLPPVLCEAVGGHHDLRTLSKDSEAFDVAAVILAASDVADIIMRGASQQRVNRLAAAFRGYFSFSGEHVGLLTRDLGPEIRRAAGMLDVPLPPAEEIHEQAKSEMLKLAISEMTGPASADAAAESVG